MTRNLLYSIITLLTSACQTDEAVNDISCPSSVELSDLKGYNIKEEVVLDNLKNGSIKTIDFIILQKARINLSQTFIERLIKTQDFIHLVQI